MATHSDILAWRIPWTEEPGELQSKGCKESDLTECLSTQALPYIKQINNKDLLYSIGNYIQYLIITYNGKASEKRIYVCVCIYIQRQGKGTPLQYSGLENPMDKGAWWATVHKVAQSWTQLKRLSTHTFRTQILFFILS